MSDDIRNNISVPHIHDTHLDTEYGEWLESLKARYQQAKVRVVVKVNGEKLLWKWQLGRELVMRKAEERWGSGVVEQLSFDLQHAFPDEKGFGSRNLWHMKQWYLFYSEKLKWPISELQAPDIQFETKLKRAVSELESNVDGTPFPILFSLIGWSHHVEIIKKTKDVEEALFYIRRTIENGWSCSALKNSMDADVYHKHPGAVSNFADKLPLPQAALAQEITKENYDFGFLTLPDGFSEAQLEAALTIQMADFLLELGKGFAFVGRQKEIVVAGRSRRIDLLFYHIYLRCYVVVELKAVAFEPEFAGKLNYYVAAVDEAVKRESDNPTIGLLICSNMDRTDVQLAFRGITTPLGVASYNNVQIEEIVKQLPTIEQLRERVKLLELQIKNHQKNSMEEQDGTTKD